MQNSEFIGYVGEPDFHDGSIVTVERESETIRVRVRGAGGRKLLLTFSRVHRVKSTSPEGMTLYALSEFACTPPYRRFVFANWDEESKSELEVEAESVSVQPE